MNRWLIGTIFVVALPVLAQSGGDFEITRSTIDGGGTTERSTNNLTIRGTFGQPDVGPSSVGAIHIFGGLWATQGRFRTLFSDGFETGDTSMWDTTVGAASDSSTTASAE